MKNSKNDNIKNVLNAEINYSDKVLSEFRLYESSVLEKSSQLLIDTLIIEAEKGDDHISGAIINAALKMGKPIFHAAEVYPMLWLVLIYSNGKLDIYEVDEIYKIALDDYQSKTEQGRIFPMFELRALNLKVDDELAGIFQGGVLLDCLKFSEASSLLLDFLYGNHGNIDKRRRKINALAWVIGRGEIEANYVYKGMDITFIIPEMNGAIHIMPTSKRDEFFANLAAQRLNLYTPILPEPKNIFVLGFQWMDEVEVDSIVTFMSFSTCAGNFGEVSGKEKMRNIQVLSGANERGFCKSCGWLCHEDKDKDKDEDVLYISDDSFEWHLSFASDEGYADMVNMLVAIHTVLQGEKLKFPNHLLCGRMEVDEYEEPFFANCIFDVETGNMVVYETSEIITISNLYHYIAPTKRA